MKNLTETVKADVLVVGAGPAGISAAKSASKSGCRVHLLDDNLAPGGQIWRAAGVSAGHGSAKGRSPKAEALGELVKSGVHFHPATRVFAEPEPGVLEALVNDSNTLRFQYKKLILATGAREFFLPFPQWTLPGVFGAGGLQALVRGGYDIAGKRVAVLGTGPLLVAVAAHLRQAGAHVVVVTEQAPIARMPSFAAALIARPGKLLQAVRYAATLRGTPVRFGWWPSEAVSGRDGKLRGVQITNGSSTATVDCDLIAFGFHLVANTELAELLGCVVTRGPSGKRVVVDAHQRTSRTNVFCAGEPTGIAGLDAALLEGEIAGLMATGRSASHLLARAASERAFGQVLDKVFALRPELRSLAEPKTIVCRCEDVSYAQIQVCNSWTDAKLRTRCGMGPCQGRICGPPTEFFFGWEPASIRPPVFPVPLHSLTSISTQDQQEIL